MKLIVKIIINAVAVWITAYLLKSGVKIDSIPTVFIVAVVLGLVNTFIKPVLNIIALPFNLLTLGLFSFVISGLLIFLVSKVVPGFHVESFLWAMLFGLVLSIVNAVLHRLT